MQLELLEDRTVPAYVVNEFTLPNPDSRPNHIIAGPDGNMWFAETNRNALAKITPNGQITEIALPDPESVGRPAGSLGTGEFLFGPDGNIWIIGRDLYEVTPAGAYLQWATDFGPNDYPLGLTLGNDSRLIFTIYGGSRVFVAPYDNPQSISWYRFPTANSWNNVVTAANGAIFAAGSPMGRVSPDGTMDEFALPPHPNSTELHRPYGITFGPDGNLWMTQEVGVDYSQQLVGRILRMNTDGQFTGVFDLPTLGAGPLNIIAGADGALWFSHYKTNQIGRITTDGVIEEIPMPSGVSGVYAIAAGTDGNIWFTAYNSNKICQIVLNQAPTANAGGPYAVVRGGNVVLDASGSSDPDQAANTLTYSWDLDGDGVYGETGVAGTRGNEVGMQPTFSAAGLNASGAVTVSLRVTDDGGVTSSASATIQVAVAALLPDSCEEGTSALFVGGAMGNDNIVVSPVGNGGTVQLTINGVSLGTFLPTGRIVVYGQDGNDDMQIAGSINRSVWLYAGAGNDRLKGGAGADVLLGEAGDDLLVGGDGRDLLIGGLGADRIVGNGDDDILIAGLTSYDADAVGLCAVMHEWTRTDLTYMGRLAHLMNGGGLNGAYALNATTVFNDTAADTLTGSSGQDWFVFDDDLDRATDLNHDAFLIDLAFING